MITKDNQKVCLLILDGWGDGREDSSNAIYEANTPYIDSLHQNFPNSELLTHGENVGLPKGQMGNSEVGHMNIGAGRIVYQELARINKSIESGDIKENKVLQQLITQAKETGKPVHIMGLVSDGGVHSHIDHISGLLSILSSEGVEQIKVHAFTDGRDTDPHSGLGFVSKIEEEALKNNGEVVSVIGRYYAMDRDRRWERTQLAYDLLVNGQGLATDSISQSIQDSYDAGITDEFIKPIVKVDEEGNAAATIKDGDIVLFVNFRTDRPRQLTTVLSQQAFPEYNMQPLSLAFYTMTNYDKTYENINIIFEKENVNRPLGEVLANAGKRQIRIAETEKYPHVTFFFNGGREVEFDGENRILISSPKVATYDLQPEMSAHDITEAIIPEIKAGRPDFVCLNFANTDMVGHTGVFEAGVKAAETVDGCVRQIVEAGLPQNYIFLITADHGNADCMVNKDGSPNTAHTTNPVPLFLVANNIDGVKLKDGILADLAPTILRLMGIEQPQEMTGKVLF